LACQCPAGLRPYQGTGERNPANIAPLSAEINILAAVTMAAWHLTSVSHSSLAQHTSYWGQKRNRFYLFGGILETDLGRLIPGRKIARSRNKSTANFIAIRLLYWNGLYQSRRPSASQRLDFVHRTPAIHVHTTVQPQMTQACTYQKNQRSLSPVIPISLNPTMYQVRSQILSWVGLYKLACGVIKGE
jgi:hypothetical protein